MIVETNKEAFKKYQKSKYLFPVPADDVIIGKQINISRKWHNKSRNRYLFPKKTTLH